MIDIQKGDSLQIFTVDGGRESDVYIVHTEAHLYFIRYDVVEVVVEMELLDEFVQEIADRLEEFLTEVDDKGDIDLALAIEGVILIVRSYKDSGG